MHTLTRRLAGVALSLASITGMFVAVAPAAEAATTPCVKQVFSYDLTAKKCVEYIQTMVNIMYKGMPEVFGTRKPLEVDGEYGTLTKSAVTNMQKHMYYTKPGSPDAYIPLDVDGITGSQTWVNLCYWTQQNSSAAAKAGCFTGPYNLLNFTSVAPGKITKAAHS